MNELEKNFSAIQSRISSATTATNRPAGSAKLLAVSKTHPIDRIEALYRLGQRDFGENYVQELVQKAEEARVRRLNEIRWHFIGHLQSNKVKLLLPHVFYIHTVDSISLAEEISKRAQNAAPQRKIQCLLSVNIDRESTKSGFDPDAVIEAAKKISQLPGVELRGLMCIPDPNSNTQTQNAFSRLRALGAALPGIQNPELSMGMTNDFEVAIREGSSWVRVGTAIFGSRE